jgi:hypothetical protein
MTIRFVRLWLVRLVAGLVRVPVRVADDFWLKGSAPSAKSHPQDGNSG